MKKMIIIVLKILVVLLIVVTLSVLAVTGITAKKNYNNVYDKDYHTEFTDVRKQVIALGLLSPSSHNMQPWRIVLDEDDDLKFEVYLDENRSIPVVDPNFDQLVISTGIFIEYMTVGAKQLGYETVVEPFNKGVLPDNPTSLEILSLPIASLTFIKTDVTSEYSFDDIAGATKRLPFDDSQINEEILQNLIELNNYESQRFEIITQENELEIIKEYLIDGVKIESQKQEAMEETSNIFRYTTYEKNKDSYGLNLHSDNTSILSRTITEFLAKVFPLSWEKEGEFWFDRDSSNIDKTNYFGMIISEGNSRETQLEVGMLYAKISIYANNQNLALQPTVQVTQSYLEMETLNNEVQTEYASATEKIQIIFRIGETSKSVDNGIRLSVDDIIN
ncbi:hypothetical protein CI105_07505 [Candidatus Izimaplasma bacterium ZiA1]|uniref:hypothetical protein n=1 Tax=Candidatus Izimoplasma sp. ZiA1 TaxID=2024899 RepID=UPI000BAA3D9D|nr:hypothetical protein CI105_07505 [Candidatus Izimaplasma bacterium ZiA1]